MDEPKQYAEELSATHDMTDNRMYNAYKRGYAAGVKEDGR